jgi:Ni,Fe-hydrogenase III large subunit
MDTLESVSGNRVNYSMNRPGGVNRDLTDPGAVVAAVRKIAEVTSKQLIPVMTANPMVRARCAGVGPLSKADAIAYGAVGPLARASGVDTDLRRSAPYDAYGDLSFEVPVRTEGDVFARIVVRALEILESCTLIEQAIETMPSGPIAGGLFPRVPAGEATVRMEAPRGEVVYYMASDGGDTPTRVRVRTPTFANMPTVRLMVLGQGISDLGLIQASIDPCYSCTDR